MPKANEKTLLFKLQQNMRAPEFKMRKFNNGFILKHYAGITEYEINGWLAKNKEPYFENIFELSVRSDDDLVKKLVSRPTKGEKKGFFRTTAEKHKEQLAYLMQHLRNTSPHFVRCILSNTKNNYSEFDNNFILNQLRCNAILEGIRIFRLGYPNRMRIRDFIERYHVIYRDFNGENEIDYIKKMLNDISVPENVYKLGLTKVFFKQGVLADIEEMTESRLIVFDEGSESALKSFSLREES